MFVVFAFLSAVLGALQSVVSRILHNRLRRRGYSWAHQPVPQGAFELLLLIAFASPLLFASDTERSLQAVLMVCWLAGNVVAGAVVRRIGNRG
jgi:hypothetical protein